MNQKFEQPSPAWLLAKEVSLIEATLLVLDIEPQGIAHEVEFFFEVQKPRHYVAMRNSVYQALVGKKLDGNVVPAGESTPVHEAEENISQADLEKTKINMGSLRKWVAQTKFPSSFFDSNDGGTPEYRDPSHPRFAPKLAAAIEVWEAFEELPDSGGRPKQRMENWLRAHAERLSLTLPNGDVNETAIFDIAKVANWDTKGGRA